MTKDEAFYIAMKEYARTHYPEACRAFTQGYDVGYKDALAQPTQKSLKEMTEADFDAAHDIGQRPWVGLTDEEISSTSPGYIVRRTYARAIEAKLKEKNT